MQTWKDFNKTIFLFLIIYLIIRYYDLSELKIIKNKNKKHKIAIVMWYNENVKGYGDLNFEINKMYCDKYGYDIIKSDQRFYKFRKPHFERIPLILNYIDNYDYIVWVDADAYFNYDSPPLENIINQHLDKYIIFSGDKGARRKTNVTNPKYIINSGFFICKCCEYTKNILLKWGYSSKLYHMSRKNYKIIKIIGRYQDQGIIRLIYYLNINNIQEHSVVVPIGVLQCFCNNNYKYMKMIHPKVYRKYKINKPFINHCAGQNSKEREIISTNYLNEIINNLK